MCVCTCVCMCTFSLVTLAGHCKGGREGPEPHPPRAAPSVLGAGADPPRPSLPLLPLSLALFHGPQEVHLGCRGSSPSQKSEGQRAPRVPRQELAPPTQLLLRPPDLRLLFAAPTRCWPWNPDCGDSSGLCFLVVEQERL